MTAEFETSRCAIVVGASRGFGRAVCQEVERQWGSSFFLLLGRDQSALEGTKAALTQSASRVVICDIGDGEATKNAMASCFRILSDSNHKFSEYYLFLNAGSLGPMDYIPDLPLMDIGSEITANITGAFQATVAFMRWLKEKPTGSLNKVRIVNVSSLVAVSPFASWSVYSVGKAARDCLMQCVAVEAPKVFPDGKGGSSTCLRSMSYAPGPLKTLMVDDLLERGCADREVYDIIKNVALLDPRESARVLVALLEMDEFLSGSHIDYFDVRDAFSG